MSSSKRAWRRRIGRVSVYQRGEQYWIYYRQGKQFRYPVGTDREESLALGAKVNAQLAEGAPTLLSFHPIDLDVLIRKWLDHHEQIRRSSLATAQRYRTAVAHLARYVESTRGNLRAERLDASLAEGFVRYLRTTPVSPNGHKNTQKRTMWDKGVVFVLESCRALFSFARDQRHLPAYSPNPFTGLAIDRMRIEDAKPIRPLTAEQEIEFFKACDGWQFRVFFLLAFTGLRVGELTQRYAALRASTSRACTSRRFQHSTSSSREGRDWPAFGRRIHGRTGLAYRAGHRRPLRCRAREIDSTIMSGGRLLSRTCGHTGNSE
jgi:hypothetical protein